jgi:hypothetical protein
VGVGGERKLVSGERGGRTSVGRVWGSVAACTAYKACKEMKAMRSVLMCCAGGRWIVLVCMRLEYCRNLMVGRDGARCVRRCRVAG